MISVQPNKEHALLTVNFESSCNVAGQQQKMIVGGGWV